VQTAPDTQDISRELGKILWIYDC